MSSRRTRLWASIAILVALLVALTGLSAPAQAATARAVTLSASPTLEYGGKPVTFSGKLTKSPKGSTVKIQRKAGSSWVAAGTTTTKTAAGAFSVVLAFPTTPAAYSYRAVAPKVGSLAAATSKTVTVTTLRKTTATLTASPATIAPGASTTLSGTVSPFKAGTAVVVQRLVNNAWVQTSAATLNSSGAFSRALAPSATSIYRIQVPRTGLNAGTTSPARVVTVSNASAPTITTTSLPAGDKGLAYSATLTKAGGAGTWAVSVGGLPLGLSLSPDTGAISGTPTGSGTSNFTVTFTETSSSLTASKALSIVVSPLPTITTTSLPVVTRGVAYSTTVTKTGKPGTWSITGLPAGLTINAETGVISGTTTAAAGTYGVYPKFTETSTGRAVLKPLALEVGGASAAITTPAPLADGHKGLAYSVTFTKTGGAGTWSIDQAPDGLTFNAATATLSGTPTVAGFYYVTVTFTETNGTPVSKGFPFKVIAPKVTTTSIPDGVTGTAYSTQFAKTGLDGTWELSSGFLPSGLTLSPSGLLSGTPTEVGDFGITVSFTETATGSFSKQAYVLHVSAPGSPTITTTSLPNGTIGTPYSATLAATPTGGTWAITYGSLPVGLSLNPTTGAITGTPAFAENAQFIVEYTKGDTKNTKFLRLLVPSPPAP